MHVNELVTKLQVQGFGDLDPSELVDVVVRAVEEIGNSELWRYRDVFLAGPFTPGDCAITGFLVSVWVDGRELDIVTDRADLLARYGGTIPDGVPQIAWSEYDDGGQQLVATAPRGGFSVVRYVSNQHFRNAEDGEKLCSWNGNTTALSPAINGSVHASAIALKARAILYEDTGDPEQAQLAAKLNDRVDAILAQLVDSEGVIWLPQRVRVTSDTWA